MAGLFSTDLSGFLVVLTSPWRIVDLCNRQRSIPFVETTSGYHKTVDLLKMD